MSDYHPTLTPDIVLNTPVEELEKNLEEACQFVVDLEKMIATGTEAKKLINTARDNKDKWAYVLQLHWNRLTNTTHLK